MTTAATDFTSGSAVLASPSAVDPMASARRRSSVDAASALQRRMPAPPPSIVRYEAPVLLQGAEGAGKRANARVNTHGVDTKTVEILDKLLPPMCVMPCSVCAVVWCGVT